MNKSECNIVAEITFLKNGSNPKDNGVRTGYNPHHKFDDIDYLISGAHLYNDMELHFPGESILAFINFASWEEVQDQVKVGDHFLIQELHNIVGEGKVKRVINE